MGWSAGAGCVVSAHSGRLGGRFRTLVVSLVVLSALMGAVGPRPLPVDAAEGAHVATDVLNVRDEPGTWGAVLDQLVWGEWVEVLDGPTWDNWYYIGYWGGVGWTLGDYVSFNGVGGYVWDVWGDGDAGLRTAAWIDTDALNIRRGASVSADVVDLVWYGDAVTVIGYTVGGYVPISHWSGTAWVWEGYLTYGGPPGPERWVDVDRSSEWVTLYEGEVVVASFWGAMGFDLSDDGFYATANGTYYVYAKDRDLSWTSWGGVWVTDWVAFDPVRLNGFHSYSRDFRGNVIPEGANPTGGCIALDPWASDFLYDFVRLGTRVEVHW